jgi:N-acetylmuramoyl-L-alanine amidase
VSARRWGIAALVAGAVASGGALLAPARAQPVVAPQELSALAWVVPDATRTVAQGDTLALDLALSQPVPWRLSRLADPPRLVMDFREVDFAALPAERMLAPGIRALRSGLVRPGWSRLVLELDGPMEVQAAAMETGAADGGAVVRLRLAPTTPARFAAAVAADAARDAAGPWAAPQPALALAPRRTDGERPLVVVLDPGHGGIDPGAERDGLREADLMLTFAQELRAVLEAAGGFEVVLTREADVFVPLGTRVAIAREAGADVFLSLHADALAEAEGGDAAVARTSGSTVYTLAEEASDAAAAALAAHHDRGDLLAGVDLTGQDDLIAAVLTSLVRSETAPQSERLAGALVGGITGEVGRMHRRPHRWAGFSVLRAPDIPSALVELGFMSSPRDLADMRDPGWRARFAAGILAALRDWQEAEAAVAPLRRR